MSVSQPTYTMLTDTSTPIQKIQAEDIGKLPSLGVMDLDIGPQPKLDLP